MPKRSKGRPGRNDPCWCGSGKKYKRCHEGRGRLPPLETGQLRAEVRRRFETKRTCFHPEAPAGCGKVIRAHTLQRSGIIQKLIGTDHHVQTFHPPEPDNNGHLKMHKVGWRKASTFCGFCESHDGMFFSAIENETFAGSPRQVLLVGYRALCHEIYQKEAATAAEGVLMENLDRGRPETDQREIQKSLAVLSAGRRTGLQEARELKKVYEHILHTNNYSLLHSVVLPFRGTPCVASTGTVHVDFDLHGNRMQNLAKDPSPVHGLTFGVVSIPDGCAFVAAWPAEFDKCDDFVRSLLSYGREEVASLLVEFFFKYVENTYFSETWWSALPTENKRRISDIVRMPIPYGTPLSYSGLRHVAWELEEPQIGLNRSGTTPTR